MDQAGAVQVPPRIGLALPDRMMQHEYSKADRKFIRKLAGIAWERQLRDELVKIGRVISEMASGDLSPFDANEHVHDFHNGISRELYNLYSGSDPWFAVCRAYYNGVLTDNDLADGSDSVRDRLQQFAEQQTTEASDSDRDFRDRC